MGAVIRRLLLNQRYYNAGNLPPSPKGKLYDGYDKINGLLCGRYSPNPASQRDWGIKKRKVTKFKYSIR